jgi:hypothetical protein
VGTPHGAILCDVAEAAMVIACAPQKVNPRARCGHNQTDSFHTVSSPHVIRTAFALVMDLLHLLRLMCRSRAQLVAENLFLRKQLACYLERQVRPRRTDNASRIALVLLARFVDWRELLTIVRPDTLVRWHRRLFRLFWRAKSRPRGRPRIPAELRRLIAEMAVANRTWGEERIAAELRLKLGLTLSPRTVRRYMPHRPPRRGGQSAQSWATFLQNHAGAVLACDFFVVVTATFQRIYVFVILDIDTRRVVHRNLTDHPTAEWTIQQFRNGVPLDGPFRFLVLRAIHWDGSTRVSRLDDSAQRAASASGLGGVDSALQR